LCNIGEANELYLKIEQPSLHYIFWLQMVVHAQPKGMSFYIKLVNLILLLEEGHVAHGCQMIACKCTALLWGTQKTFVVINKVIQLHIAIGSPILVASFQQVLLSGFVDLSMP